MLTAKYEKYWCAFKRQIETRSFLDLEHLENWIFEQISDYSQLHFPTPEAAARIRENGPWAIEFRSAKGEETVWIHQISSERGIIFTDGTFTNRQKHWSQNVQDWLRRCEKRRKNPCFDFVE